MKKILKIFLFSYLLVNMNCRQLETIEPKSQISTISIDLRDSSTSDISGIKDAPFIKDSIYELPNNPNYNLKVKVTNSNEKKNFNREVKPFLREGLPYKVLVYDLNGDLTLEKECKFYSNKKEHIQGLQNGKTYTFVIYASTRDNGTFPALERKEKLSTLTFPSLEEKDLFSIKNYTIGENGNILETSLSRGLTKIKLVLDTTVAGMVENTPSIIAYTSSLPTKLRSSSIEKNSTLTKEIKFNQKSPLGKSITSEEVLMMNPEGKFNLLIDNLEAGNLIQEKNIILKDIPVLSSKKAQINLTLVPKQEGRRLKIMILTDAEGRYRPSPGIYAANLFPRCNTISKKPIDIFLHSRENISKIEKRTNTRISEIEVVVASSIQQGINKHTPDVILYTYPNTKFSKKEERAAFKNFLENGGKAILFMESGSYSCQILKDLLDINVISRTTPTNSTRKLENIEHPILNGPFGDLRGKYVGDDNTAATITWDLQNCSTIDILSKTNERVFAFAHKNYALVVLGEGGFLSGGIPVSTNKDWMPFAVKLSGAPTTKIHGKSEPKEVYNSAFFGNALTWVLRNK